MWYNNSEKFQPKNKFSTELKQNRTQKNRQVARGFTAGFTAGFTLIEIIVGLAIAAILLVGVIGTFQILTRSARAAREQTVLSSLASNYLEVIRNLPYSQVGTINGNPGGSLWDFSNAQTSTIEGVAYKIYYEVTYIDDPADGTIAAGTDAAPNDYKQVKMFVQNTATSVITTFLTNVSPKGLEGLNNAGALSLQVIDSQGQPLASANLHIVNSSLNPDIILDRQTDSQGKWIEVGLPASVNGYHITATKSGYSTDQTYPITAQNPNPTKPDATIVNGSVTQISFAIDLVANLTIKTLDSVCQNLSGVGVNVVGSKIIGTSPSVLKFDNNYTSSGGQIALSNIEWDAYTPSLLTGQSRVVLGTSPIQQISVLPGSSQVYTMILGTSATPNTLLVIVKDAGTGAAVEGAIVHLQKGGGAPEDFSAVTGGSVWVQSDWSGGAGQINFSDDTRYFVDDGNVDTTAVPTGLRLKNISGSYQLSGSLESSTFDTGAASNFTILTWQPASQSSGTAVKFQIASSTDANNNNVPWIYKGPDGTATTYYSVSGNNISAAHDGDQYVRFKAFLTTPTDTATPVLTSVNINYVSGCYTPGQSSFVDLAGGSNYTLDVSLPGYQTATINNLNISGHQVLEVQLSP